MKLKKIIFALMACCLSLGVLIVPISASDDKHACPTEPPKGYGDKPYHVIVSFPSTHTSGSSVGCNGIEKVYIESEFPIFVDTSNDSYKFTTESGGIVLQRFINRTFTRDPPEYKIAWGNPCYSKSGNYTYETNHEIKDITTGEVVFQEPQDPTEGMVLGEWWIAILNQITPNAPVILMAIGGILLLILFQILLKKSRKSSRP